MFQRGQIRITAFLLLWGMLGINPNLFLQAATFGQNKVQYNYFRWKYLTTEHFDIYYNQNGRAVADFTAEAAEDAYAKLARSLRYYPENANPIIVVTYQSHNDFEQTNITSEEPEESVGGFTEFLRNRVVAPFEGDYEKYRHVIHHELTHALMLNLLYGQGLGAVVSGLTQTRVPLWFIEGMAEYQSRNGLDSETEMFLRDAVVNDLLPELNRLDELGYLGVYKCGQSVVYWIAWRYGEEKLGELLHNLKGLRDFDRALKASLGIDQEELSKRWRRFLKERYWPQVVQMDTPDRLAERLTDHEEEFNFVNNSPALSPNGEWLAFLSDRSDYFDVYLMKTIDGKISRRLVHGQRSGKFEELHWLRPGLTWSPDSRQIAFCAKSGGSDALYLVNVKDGTIARTLGFESDGLFSPNWSPDGRYIALIRVLNGRSDLAVVDLDRGSLDLLTNDMYDEADPSWSPDGQRILFTSNRQSVTLDDHPDRTLFGHKISEFDIYEYHLGERKLTRLTDDSFEERTPLWSPLPNTILYVGARSGAYNLYLHNLETREVRALTNMVTAAFQPTLSLTGKTVVFTSYYNNGYDLFLLQNPFHGEDAPVPLSLPAADEIPPSAYTGISSGAAADYSTFVFNRSFSSPDTNREEIDSSKIVSRIKTSEGIYSEHEYKVHLAPDLVYVSASYSPYFRMQGSGLLAFADVLGNHQLYIALDLNRSTDNSNYYVNYQYLARRVNISQGAYHFAYPYYSDRIIWRDRNYGFYALAGYPLNRYNRVEWGLDYLVIDRSVYWTDLPYSPDGIKISAFMPSIGYVHDTSVWHASVEPGNGSRWRVDALWSPDLILTGDRSLKFHTFAGDWRRYINYRKDYAFAIRASGGLSQGPNPQRFFLGGMVNWFNPRYDNSQGEAMVDNVEDIYFASFVTPLRGVGYYNQTGTRFLLGNAEFRFPFIRHLLFGWPLPAYIRNLRGSLFTDYGAAWTPQTNGGSVLPKKGVLGFGFGLRIHLGILPLEWDVAWSPDPSSDMVPRHYLSINLGF